MLRQIKENSVNNCDFLKFSILSWATSVVTRPELQKPSYATASTDYIFLFVHDNDGPASSSPFAVAWCNVTTGAYMHYLL